MSSRQERSARLAGRVGRRSAIRVALRLAVSEADLYRKQRAAIEQVAQAIAEMEREAAERATDYDAAG